MAWKHRVLICWGRSSSSFFKRLWSLWYRPWISSLRWSPCRIPCRWWRYWWPWHLWGRSGSRRRFHRPGSPLWSACSCGLSQWCHQGYLRGTKRGNTHFWKTALNCPVNKRNERLRVLFLTKQFAELIISLLVLSFPSSGESHSGDAGGWRCEGRCWGKLREQQGTQPDTRSSLYTALLPLPHLHLSTREGNYSRRQWGHQATRGGAINSRNGHLWEDQR